MNRRACSLYTRCVRVSWRKKKYQKNIETSTLTFVGLLRPMPTTFYDNAVVIYKKKKKKIKRTPYNTKRDINMIIRILCENHRAYTGANHKNTVHVEFLNLTVQKTTIKDSQKSCSIIALYSEKKKCLTFF